MTPYMLHATVHNNVVIEVNKQLPEYLWAIELDLQIGDTKFRPDIVGIREGNIEIAIEISDSTIHYDTHGKKGLFEELGIKYYLVFDCQRSYIHRYTLTEAGILESSDIFKDKITESVFRIGEKD